MEHRYSALRVIATIYKVVGVVVAAVAVLGGLGACALSAFSSAGSQTLSNSGLPVGTGLLGGIVLALVAILAGGVYAILLYGAGDVISLLIALEENTRVTSSLLKQAFTGPTLPGPTITPTPTTSPTLPSK